MEYSKMWFHESNKLIAQHSKRLIEGNYKGFGVVT